MPTRSGFKPTAPAATLVMAGHATAELISADRLLSGVAPRHRTQLVQQFIPESPEDVEGLYRRDPDQAKAARQIQAEMMAATPTMRANAARCRRAKTPGLPTALCWQPSADDRLEVDDPGPAETTEIFEVCTDQFLDLQAGSDQRDNRAQERMDYIQATKEPAGGAEAIAALGWEAVGAAKALQGLQDLVVSVQIFDPEICPILEFFLKRPEIDAATREQNHEQDHVFSF